MLWRTHKLGLSLMEIVLSTSLLAGAFMLFSGIFGVALRSTAQAGDMAVAIAEANSQLTRLETLAVENRWSDLLSENGTNFENNGFTVEISLAEVPAYSPSSSMEQVYVPLASDRRLDSVLAQAEVRVRRDNVSTTQVRLLGRPVQELANPPIEFRGLPSSTLGRDDSVSVTAHLLAADGSEIPATFRFYIVPQSGNGSIDVSRNGRQASFTNVIQNGSGVSLYTGGRCQLRAKTIYFGREVSIDSGDLELDS